MGLDVDDENHNDSHSRSDAVRASGLCADRAQRIIAGRSRRHLDTGAQPVTAIIVASVNGGAYTSGSLNVAVGSVVTFALEPCGTPYPAQITVLVNGKDLSFASGTALGFTADKAGIWTVSLDMPGFQSNSITVTAK